MSKIARYLVLLVCLCSFNTLAHFQGPMKVKKIVYSENTSIDITVGNDSSFDQYFQIYVDGVVSGDEFLIRSSKQKVKSIIFPVERDRKETFEVCSVSLPTSKVKIRTRICTSVKLLYPYSRLQLQN